LNKKEEANVIDVIGGICPEREHSPGCMDRFIFGAHHENCICKCHEEKKVGKEKKSGKGSAAI